MTSSETKATNCTSSLLSSQPVALNDPALICSLSVCDPDDFPFSTEQTSTMSCSFTRQDVLDRLAVMKEQESTKRQHAVRDYLGILDNCTSTTSENDDISSDSSSEGSSKEIEHKMHRMTIVTNRMLTSKGQQVTDVACREKMAMWTFQVVDYCNLNRHTAELAMRMMDRFLSQNNDTASPRNASTSIAQECLVDRKKYQLAAMTCLYTSIKINEAKFLDPDIIASLSRGMATPAKVVQMEGHILRALDWHIGGPTGTDVVDHLVQLLPKSVPQHVKRSIIERARCAIHQSLLDYELSTIISPTALGYAALVHSLGGLDEWNRTQYIDRDAIVADTDVTEIILDCHTEEEDAPHQDSIAWAIARLDEITTDGSNTNRRASSSKPRSSPSKASSSSSGTHLSSSSSEPKRSDIKNNISPRTVVGQPAATAA